MIEQAARMGGAPLPSMMQRLRAAAGVRSTDLASAAAAGAESAVQPCLAAARVIEEIDADVMLERGV